MEQLIKRIHAKSTHTASIQVVR